MKHASTNKNTHDSSGHIKGNGINVTNQDFLFVKKCLRINRSHSSAFNFHTSAFNLDPDHSLLGLTITLALFNHTITSLRLHLVINIRLDVH